MRKLLPVLVLFGSLHAADYEAYLETLRHDPAVLSAQLQSESYSHRSGAASALSDPQLILGVDNLPVEDPAFDRYLPTAKVIGISQKFTIGRDEEQALFTAHEKLQLLKSQELYAELVALFYNTLNQKKLLAQQLQNLKAQYEFHQQMREELAVAMQSGMDDYADIVLMETEQIENRQMQQQLLLENEKLEHRLERLVGEVPTIDLPRLEFKSFESDELFDVAFSKLNLEIASADAQRAQSKEGIEAGVQLLYKQREAGENFDGEDWVTLRGNFTLPFWEKRSQESAAALSKVESQRYTLEDTKRAALERMQNLRSSYERQEQTLNLTFKQLELIEESLESKRERYEQGSLRYLSLLKTELLKLKTAYKQVMLEAKLRALKATYNRYIMENR